MLAGVAEETTSFVAECFWPGVEESDLAALDRRVQAVVGDAAGRPGRVRYLGSILMRQDEVVLCQFEGTAEAVRDAAERAAVPFERILETTHSPWPTAGTA
jgi:hypothetical protein